MQEVVATVRDHVSLSLVFVSVAEVGDGEGLRLPVHDGPELAGVPLHLSKVFSCCAIYLGVVSLHHEKYQHGNLLVGGQAQGAESQAIVSVEVDLVLLGVVDPLEDLF